VGLFWSLVRGHYSVGANRRVHPFFVLVICSLVIWNCFEFRYSNFGFHSLTFLPSHLLNFHLFPLFRASALPLFHFLPSHLPFFSALPLFRSSALPLFSLLSPPEGSAAARRCGNSRKVQDNFNFFKLRNPKLSSAGSKNAHNNKKQNKGIWVKLRTTSKS